MHLDVESYRKDLAYPNRLKSGYFYGYGHPTAKNAPATRDWHDIKAVLIHTTNNPQGNTRYAPEAKFLRDAPNVSIHYVVSSHDDTIVQVLPDNYIAWHAGDCLDNDFENIRSIGIELAWTTGKGDLPQIAIDNLTALMRRLLNLYPWMSRAKIDMHRAQAVYPNGKLGRKIDPSGWSDVAFYEWRSGLFASSGGATQPGHALLTEDTSIISAPRATLEQCRRYMLSRAHTHYDEYDIGQIILPRYFEVCQQVGVDPLVAIAQMIHETGNLCSFWSARPQRNPAGIGVTGLRSPYQPIA